MHKSKLIAYMVFVFVVLNLTYSLALADDSGSITWVYCPSTAKIGDWYQVKVRVTCDYKDNINENWSVVLCIDYNGDNYVDYCPMHRDFNIKPGESLTLTLGWLITKDVLNKIPPNQNGFYVYVDYWGNPYYGYVKTDYLGRTSPVFVRLISPTIDRGVIEWVYCPTSAKVGSYIKFKIKVTCISKKNINQPWKAILCVDYNGDKNGEDWPASCQPDIYIKPGESKIITCGFVIPRDILRKLPEGQNGFYVYFDLWNTTDQHKIKNNIGKLNSTTLRFITLKETRLSFTSYLNNSKVNISKSTNLNFLKFIIPFIIIISVVALLVYVKKLINSTKSVYTTTKTNISAGWAIYDPVKQDFVPFRPQCETSIRDWINRYGPLNYWLAVCITNNSDQPINRFEIEFEVSSLLEVRRVYVQGFEGKIPFHREKGSRVGSVKYTITVPEELGVAIPIKGSKRIYIDLHSKVCGQRYTIENGRIRAENTEVKLNDLDFWYSCEIYNIYEKPELANTREGRKLIEQIISIKLEKLDRNRLRDVITYYNHMHELIDEGVKTAMKYVNDLIVLRNLVGDTEFYRYLEKGFGKVFARRCVKKLDQLINMPDYEVQLPDEALREMRKILIDALKHL